MNLYIFSLLLNASLISIKFTGKRLLSPVSGSARTDFSRQFEREHHNWMKENWYRQRQFKREKKKDWTQKKKQQKKNRIGNNLNWNSMRVENLLRCWCIFQLLFSLNQSFSLRFHHLTFGSYGNFLRYLISLLIYFAIIFFVIFSSSFYCR